MPVFHEKLAGAAILLMCGIVSCQSTEKHSDPGHLQFSFKSAVRVTDDSQYGVVQQYRITVTGEKMPVAIVRSYDAGTSAAQFDGLPAGPVDITAEVINIYDAVIRRGVAKDVVVHGGETVPVSLTVNPVPIFTNLVDGARIPENRFVPKIYFPAAGTVELVELTADGSKQLTNVLTNESGFSLSIGDGSPLFTLAVNPMLPGEHELEVRDVATGESSQVHVEILPQSNRPVLPTSAGSYLGAMQSITKQRTSLIDVHNRILSNIKRRAQ